MSTPFELHIIFGQRKESYPGEHAPEALDIADECTMDENPEWLLERQGYHQKDPSFESVKIVKIVVPLESIMSILRPAANPAIPGKVAE